MLPSGLTAYMTLLTPGITPSVVRHFHFESCPIFSFPRLRLLIYKPIYSERIDRSVFSLALPGAYSRVTDWRARSACAQARFVGVHNV